MSFFSVTLPKRRLFTLKTIKPNKAHGPDDIYPKILVECAEELGDVVLSIFKSSFNSGQGCQLIGNWLM